MTVLDLTAAARLFLGAQEVAALHHGSRQIWARPAPQADIAFPDTIFDTYGIVWDPYHPGMLQTNGGAVAVPGSPVGLLPPLGSRIDYSGTVRVANMLQATDAARPVLVETAGRRALSFDGIDDFMDCVWVERFEPPVRFTAFAMVLLTATTGGCGLTFARAETSASRVEVLFTDPATHQIQTNIRHKAATFVTNAVDFSAAYGWRLLWMEYELNAYEADGARFRLWLDDTLVRDALVTPAKDATASVTVMTRAQIGASRSGGTRAAFFNSQLGRSGSISRLLGATEKATLQRWLRGTSWVA